MDLDPSAVFMRNGSQIYRCGNKNGYASNASSYTPLVFYECGRYEGKYEARNSGAHLSVKNCLKMWLVATLLLSLPLGVAAYDLIDTRGDGISNVLKIGPDSDHLHALKVASQHGYDILNTTDHTYIGNVTASYNSTATLDKRLCRSFTYSKYQLARQGESESPWYQISKCLDVGYDTAEVQKELRWQYTNEWSIDTGPIGWEPISALIGGSWSRSVSKSGSQTCIIPAGTVGCVWYQTKIKWFDAQVQQCHHNGCSGTTTCDAWSRSYHGNAPHVYNSKDRTATNIGCSTGHDHCNC